LATDKRARKKEHRDAALAQRQALLRRRRAARVGAVATVLVLIVAAAVITGGADDDEGNDAAGNAPAETAAPTPPPEESSEPEPAGAVACGAEAPPKANPQQYPEAEQVLEDGVDYRAILETSCGTLEIDLLEENAPVTVNNFVFLSKEGFYDGLTFHRVEPQFVIQGGDPQGTGGGGPGYQFEDELWAKSKEYDYGTVAMANAGPDTNGSQFFVIVHKPTDQPAALAPAYSVFGEVPRKSWPTLEKIRKVDTSGSTPVSTVYIESVEIVEGGAR
jgi:cyclophilin family peptidyl-prolyl cis-trans isomerase